MRVLVMGCGEIGLMVASALWREGHQVTVMDAAVGNLRRLPKELQLDAILGDGTQEDELRRAGIESRDAFVALSSEDTDNIFAAQMARHVFHLERVVCRIDDTARCEVYSELGLNAVSTVELTSNLILQAVYA